MTLLDHNNMAKSPRGASLDMKQLVTGSSIATLPRDFVKRSFHHLDGILPSHETLKVLYPTLSLDTTSPKTRSSFRCMLSVLSYGPLEKSGTAVFSTTGQALPVVFCNSLSFTL